VRPRRVKDGRGTRHDVAGHPRPHRRRFHRGPCGCPWLAGEGTL